MSLHERHEEHEVIQLLRNLLRLESRIMATVQDFVTAANAFFDRMDTAVADIQADIANLDDQISKLQTADQPALDAVKDRLSGLADKVDALDALTPPVAPPTT